MSGGANPPPGRRRRLKKDDDVAGAKPPPGEDRQSRKPETFEECPGLDFWCDECATLGKRERQRQSPHGPTCKFGHGGAPGIPFDGRDYEDQHGDDRECDRRDEVIEEEMRIEEVGKAATIVSREGDTLHVRFPEVTLPLRAKYASAKVGGLSMTRTLRKGEDVEEAGREMAAVLRELSLEIARATITDFDDELKASRESR